MAVPAGPGWDQVAAPNQRLSISAIATQLTRGTARLLQWAGGVPKTKELQRTYLQQSIESILAINTGSTISRKRRKRHAMSALGSYVCYLSQIYVG